LSAALLAQYAAAPGETLERGQAGDADDVPPPAGEHPRQHRLGRVHDAEEVHPQDLLHHRDVHLLRPGVVAHPGVGDQ
jgi:hypothetical protein